MIWVYGAWIDLKNKYRRTTIGVGWNFLTLFITVMIMTTIWSLIFKINFFELFPYIFNGFAIYFFITNSINISCYSLVQIRKDIYFNINIPILVLVLRDVFQQLLTYTQYMILIIFFYIYQYSFNFFNILLFFFGLIIVFIQTIFICLIVSFVATRFRDVAALITSLLSAATLLTPVIWKKEMLGVYQNYVYLNPLSFMVEIIRDPIIDIVPQLFVYMLNIFFLLILFIISFVLVKTKGARLILWV
jgi:ABC-type polysaccharide/polyol phosphate export permease